VCNKALDHDLGGRYLFSALTKYPIAFLAGLLFTESGEIVMKFARCTSAWLFVARLEHGVVLGTRRYWSWPMRSSLTRRAGS
jgi:hypothetical protein